MANPGGRWSGEPVTAVLRVGLFAMLCVAGTLHATDATGEDTEEPDDPPPAVTLPSSQLPVEPPELGADNNEAMHALRPDVGEVPTHVAAAHSPGDALQIASRDNDATAIRAAIQQGADPNAYSWHALPLWQACDQWRLAPLRNRDLRLKTRLVITALFEGGADPNLVTDENAPLPLFGYLRRNAELFKLALDKGANPSLRRNGQPLVYSLISLYPGSQKTLDILLQYHPDLNSPFEESRMDGAIQNGTILHYVVFFRDDSDQPDPAGYFGPTDYLLRHGADPNHGDTEGRTPLHWAVMQGQENAVRSLLKAGANTNLRDKAGFPPIVYARTALVAKMLAAAEPTLTNADLHESMEQNHPLAVMSIYSLLSQGLAPVWPAVWLLLLGLAVLGIRRRQARLAEPPAKDLVPADRAPGSASASNRPTRAGRVRHGRKTTPPRGTDESHAESAEERSPIRTKATRDPSTSADWSGTVRGRQNAPDRKEAKAERIRARYEQRQPYLLVPLASWALTWGLFFVDPYLRALGLIPNLTMFAVGLVVAASTIPLMTGSLRMRVILSWVGLLFTLGGMAFSLYYTRLFWQFEALWPALVFTLHAAVQLFLGWLFWQAFNTAYVLRKLNGNQKPLKLTAADELEAVAGWDQSA